MNEALFIVLSALYILSLATIDGLFNRLVFKEKRTLPYDSSFKKNVYKRWEWRAIGIILLIFLPVILPSMIAYLVGGVPFVTLYWIILLFIPWDMIFGALVFDDWFGDHPSIALPFCGWITIPLWPLTIVRIGLIILLVILKLKFRI